jgi:hypothetical protein
VIVEPGTKADLLEDARTAGYEVTSRLITDWVERGLVDQPTRRSKGRGRGSAAALYTANQRNLFLVLLHQRTGITNIASLCNLPVWLWLGWGDEYVPLRQVRRALATWTAKYGKPGWERCVRTAREVVDQLTRPELTRAARRDIADTIALAAFNGSANAEQLTEPLATLVETAAVGSTNRPGQMTVDEYLWLVQGRLRVLDQLKRLPDDAYRRARLVFNQTWAEYLGQLRPIWEEMAEPKHKHLFREPAIAQRVNQACIELITILAIVTQHDDTPPTT